MELTTATGALAALAHPTRLQAFRLLVQAGKPGLAVGSLAAGLGTAANGRLSFHLKELVSSGLAKARQEGRFIYYAAHYEAMTDLLRYLTENCCGGSGCGERVDPCATTPDASTPAETPS